MALFEYIGGKCRICEYDRLYLRIGSVGYFNVEACARCGFAIGHNQLDHKKENEEVWGMVTSHFGAKDRKELFTILEKWSPSDLDYQIPNMHKNGIFEITEEDREKHKKLKMQIYELEREDG